MLSPIDSPAPYNVSVNEIMSQQSLKRDIPEATLEFLAGGGEMGAIIRAFDWCASTLGSPQRWPQALRTAVRLMLGTNHPVFIFWGPDHICFYNDAYKRSIGPEKHPAMLGARGREMWEEIWHIIGPQIEQVMAGEGATWHEDHLVPIVRHGALEQVYWTYSYSPIDHAGGVGGVLVICTETTQRVLTEQRRQAEFDRLRELFQQAPSFVTVLTGPEHRFEFVNEAYQRLIGRRDVIGKSVAEALPEVADQGFVALLDDVYRTGETFVGRRSKVLLKREPDAPAEEFILDFIYKAIRDPSGAISGVFVEGYDITERSHAEQALQTALSELQAIYDQSPVGMLQLDSDLRYVRINNALAVMNGIPAADHIGKTLSEIVPDLASKVEAAFRRVIDTGEPILNVELEGETKADPGVKHTWLESWYPTRNTHGEVTGLNIVAQDVTDRKTAERTLQENEQHLRFLVDELNHRVKNTLAIVQGLARQTLKGIVPDQALRAFDGRLRALASALNLLTRENWQAADLKEIATEVLLSHDDANRFTIEGPKLGLNPKAAVTVGMALHELCTNARKYGALSNKLGHVEISWEIMGSLERQMRLRWKESGGPPVEPPTHHGFGSRMIETVLANELHGTVRFNFHPSGVVCEIDAGLPDFGSG